MSKKIGRKINEGISAEIFEWENNKKIIKLSKNKKNRKAMRTEYLNTKAAWENGVSVPQVFRLVDTDGCLGIVLERIYGETLMERFVNKRGLNYEEVAQITARILSETHEKTVQNISSQRDPIIYSINKVKHLTTSEKKFIFEILNRIPIKQKLCHGDPNLNNILMRDNKAVLIDWRYASIGNPEADLAEFIIMTRYATIKSKDAEYINSIREKMIKVFIDEYTKLSNITYEDIDAWIIPMAARRLSANIIPKFEKEQLVNEIRRRLKIYK